MKNRSWPHRLSTDLAVHGKEIALHLDAGSRCTHTSHCIHMYIYTETGRGYTHLRRNKQPSIHTEQARRRLLKANLLIQQGAHLASYLQEKYQRITPKTIDKGYRLPFKMGVHFVAKPVTCWNPLVLSRDRGVNRTPYQKSKTPGSGPHCTSSGLWGPRTLYSHPVPSSTKPETRPSDF